MRNYFFSLSIALGLYLAAAPVFAITTFDLSQFEQKCPSVNALTYTAHIGGGVINGTQNAIKFISESAEPAPQHLIDNIIQGVQPRLLNGMYGFQDGNAIACYYHYTNFLNGPVYLTMWGSAID